MINKILARIDHNESETGGFDPFTVWSRLECSFPGVEKLDGDHLEETCISLIKLANEDSIGAVRIALKDLLQKGPALRYRIPAENGEYYTGVIDRHRVSISSESSFTADFENRFGLFLSELKFPTILVSSE